MRLKGYATLNALIISQYGTQPDLIREIVLELSRALARTIYRNFCCYRLTADLP